MSRTLDYEIIFTTNSEDNLIGYTNSDYTELIDNQKFIGGYIFILSGGSLSYQLKLQSIITLLLTEGKYMAIMEIGKKVL